jgi:hypothetical protein
MRAYATPRSTPSSRLRAGHSLTGRAAARSRSSRSRRSGRVWALFLLAAALEAPFLASLRHQAGGRADLAAIEEGFFPTAQGPAAPRALVFTDTFEETNGVAGTMRQLVRAAAEGEFSAQLVLATEQALDSPGVIDFRPDWSAPIPGQEGIELRFPALTEVLARVEHE